jgi:hypothetical protein
MSGTLGRYPLRSPAGEPSKDGQLLLERLARNLLQSRSYVVLRPDAVEPVDALEERREPTTHVDIPVQLEGPRVDGRLDVG